MSRLTISGPVCLLLSACADVKPGIVIETNTEDPVLELYSMIIEYAFIPRGEQ